MSDGGKGSSPRPYSVDQKTFSNNWDMIFGKKNQKEIDDDLAEKEEFEHLKKINELTKK
jgi:hypothetical protein